MANAQRHTSLSLQEVLSLLKGNIRNGHYPRCLLINELGTIVSTGGQDEENQGRDFLVSLLSAEVSTDRAVAYSYLAINKEWASENQEILDKFREEPRNVDMMDNIDKSIAKFLA